MVLPQEGSSLIACATSRFELETFSGTVTDTKSDALNASQNPILQFIFRKPVCQAVHELVVRSPDGVSRTFRFGTESPDIPASVTQRVTVVASPSNTAVTKKKGLLSSRPPGTRPGEPLSIVNHVSGVTSRALRPPIDSSGLPTWLVPLIVVMAAGDAGSFLLDPSYPLLIAGGAASAATALAGGSTFLIPKWKQLPENMVRL